MTQTNTDALDSRLKRVLRFMPAPVGIVTSYDPDTGAPVGLAMSALMPVSLEPCAMAICVNRSGSAHEALIRAGHFCINLLRPGQEQHVTPFADPSAREARFTHGDWRQHDRVWYIENAAASIFCTVRERVPFGTHDVLIGEVNDLFSTDREDILGWANGSLCRLAPVS